MVGLRVVVTLNVLLLASTGGNARAQTPVLQGKFFQADPHMVIDGRLDESAWAAASPVTQFFEIYPANIGTPTVGTEARFLYDEKNIYIGVRAYDPNPKAIRAAIVRRDQVLDDQDYVELLIDPSNGRHNALLFRTNAKGVATDGQFNEEAQTRDYTVDLNFDVSASIDNQGWTAEFRIPLATLRYETGDNQAWTIIVFRNLPRDKTVTIASAPITRKANCTLCFAQEISGISLASARDPVSLVPYVTFSRSKADNGVASSASSKGHAGFDVKWQPQPNTVVDVTVSPDFSQVEADDLQLTANTRFALSITEKRPFFLEGSDLLLTSTGINAIYTRAFTAPDAGARASRRGNDYEYSALLLRDTGGGSVIEPGPVRSQLGPQGFTSTAFVGRYRLHEGNVTWGTLATARLNQDGSENLVYGGDTSWAPTLTDRFFAQFLGSHTRNPDRPDLLPSWIGQRFDGAGGALTWTHSANAWYADVYLRSYSPGFRAWNGFVPQVGMSSVAADTGINFYPHNLSLVRISLLVSVSHIREIGGGELGRYAAPGILFDGSRDTSLAVYWYRHLEDITLAGLRSYNYVYMSLMSTPAPWMPKMTLTASVGEGLDATTGEVGDGLTVQTTIPIRLFNRFEIRPTLAYQSLNSRRPDLAHRRLFTEIDTQADVLWHFSSRLYLEALYQKSRFRRPPQSDPLSLETRSTGTLSSFLLSYQTNWQTRFYAGVRHGASRLQGTEPARGNQTEIFAKLTYAFVK